MITCLGLVVGYATTNNDENLKQCVKFLNTYPHTLKTGTTFEINRVPIYTVTDITKVVEGHKILFQRADGHETVMYTSENVECAVRCFRNFCRGLLWESELEDCLSQIGIDYDTAEKLYRNKIVF